MLCIVEVAEVGLSKAYIEVENAWAVTSHLNQNISERTVIVTACCRQSEGMLKAI